MLYDQRVTERQPDPHHELASAASGFEEEEKTSPEVVRQRASDKNPVIVIASGDGSRRRHLIELLCSDGWNAVEAHDPGELLEICGALSPQVVLIDAGMQLAEGGSTAETLRAQRPGASTRLVAMLPGASAADIASALADGFDDFVSDIDNNVEIVARATANLRGARTLAEVQKQRRDARLLLELSQTLASSLDMQLILHTVSRLVAEVIALERCSIVLLDPNQDDAVMVAASEDRTVRDLRIRLSNYPELKRCVETGQPLMVDDVDLDPVLMPVSRSLKEKGIRTMALFPIVYEETVTGVLFLRSSKPTKHLTQQEVQFGQTVASACAVAIRNARLFDQFRDQTEHIESMRAQAERQTEALRKYQDFFEYAADGISVIDGDGRVLYVNKEGRRLIGKTREEVHLANFQDLLVDESAAIWPEVVAQVKHGRFKRSFDVYVKHPGGERVFSLSAGGVGQGTGLIILSFRDVTETREMESELRTTKEFLENLIDNSVDAIVAADMNGNIMLFNKGAEKVYGYRAEEVIGRMHVSQLYPAGGANDVMRKLRDERWGGKGRLSAERRDILTATGDAVPVSMTASIIYEDGEEVATTGVFTDLRDRMAMERQLSAAQEELTKADKARVAAELAGMAAHELNQPLTSVLGYAEMLRARVPESDARLRRPVETIFKQAERMAEIVRKIGRITKYETKRYGLNTDMIDLNRASVEDGRDPATITQNFGHPVQPRDGASATASPPPSMEDDMITAPPRPAPRDERESLPISRPPARPTAVTDPRAAIIRLDTIEEPRGYARTQRELAEKSKSGSSDPGRTDGREKPNSSIGGPQPLAVTLGAMAPAPSDPDDDTNPGVKVPEGRKPLKG